MYEISKSRITIEKKNMPVHKRRRATEHVKESGHPMNKMADQAGATNFNICNRISTTEDYIQLV